MPRSVGYESCVATVGVYVEVYKSFHLEMKTSDATTKAYIEQTGKCMLKAKVKVTSRVATIRGREAKLTTAEGPEGPTKVDKITGIDKIISPEDAKAILSVDHCFSLATMLAISSAVSKATRLGHEKAMLLAIDKARKSALAEFTSKIVAEVGELELKVHGESKDTKPPLIQFLKTTIENICEDSKDDYESDGDEPDPKENVIEMNGYKSIVSCEGDGEFTIEKIDDSD